MQFIKSKDNLETLRMNKKRESNQYLFQILTNKQFNSDFNKTIINYKMIYF